MSIITKSFRITKQVVKKCYHQYSQYNFIGDYIEATFLMNNDHFCGYFKGFTDAKDTLFHSPLFTVMAPFRTYNGENTLNKSI